MKSPLLFATVTTAVVLSGGHPALAAKNFVTIVDPTSGTVSTQATGINSSGLVVGTSYDSSGNSHGFSLSGGTYNAINVPGAAMTTASGVNNAGTITGYVTDNSGGVHGFTQTGVTPVQYDYTPAAATGGATYGSATNTTGAWTTVGYFYDNSIAAHGFTMLSGSFATLDVTGTTHSTQALGINDAGTVVGSFSGGGVTHGFVYDGTSYTQLDDPLGVNGTVATTIDNGGDVGGYYVDGGGVTHGFVRMDGAFYTVDDPNAGGITAILGINDQRAVVGYYVDPNGVMTGFQAEVPEPASFALFGLSALGVARLRRRRSHSLWSSGPRPRPSMTGCGSPIDVMTLRRAGPDPRCFSHAPRR